VNRSDWLPRSSQKVGEWDWAIEDALDHSLQPWERRAANELAASRDGYLRNGLRPLARPPSATGYQHPTATPPHNASLSTSADTARFACNTKHANNAT
jgi:hypothetical protein